MWFFDIVSPFSYLQLADLERLPTELIVKPRPVLLAGLLQHWGQIGPAELPPKRVHTYRMCVWLAEQRGLPFRLPPAHPFNPLKVLRLLVALDADLAAIRTAFEIVFAEGRDPNEAECWRDLTQRLGVADADALITDPEVKNRLRANTEEAIAHGVFGVPTFLIDGETFWGSDSFGLLTDYLRDPGLFQRGEMARAATLPVGARRLPPR